MGIFMRQPVCVSSNDLSNLHVTYLAFALITDKISLAVPYLKKGFPQRQS